MFKVMLLGSLLLMLTGCATAIHGSAPQTVLINSEPAGADVEIINLLTNETLTRDKTPYRVTIKTSGAKFNPLFLVKISMPGYYNEHAYIKSEIRHATIVSGMFLDFGIVDAITGAKTSVDNRPIKAKLYLTTQEGGVARAKARFNIADASKNWDADEIIADSSIPLEMRWFPLIKFKFPQATFERGKAYLTKKMYSEAEEDFDAVIDKDDICSKEVIAESYFGRGSARQKLDESEDAKEDLKKACELGYKKACDMFSDSRY